MYSSSKRIVRVNKRDIKLRSTKLLLEGRVNIFHVHLSVNLHSWKLLRAKSLEIKLYYDAFAGQFSIITGRGRNIIISYVSPVLLAG